MAKTTAKRPKTMDSTLTVKLPSDLHERAIEKSGATGVAIAFVVRKALEEWTDEKKGGRK